MEKLSQVDRYCLLHPIEPEAHNKHCIREKKASTKGKLKQEDQNISTFNDLHLEPVH